MILLAVFCPPAECVHGGALLDFEDVGPIGAGEKNRLRQFDAQPVERLRGVLARGGLVVQVRGVLLVDGGQFQAAEVPDHALRRCQVRCRKRFVEQRAQQPLCAQPFQRDQQVVVGADSSLTKVAQILDQLAWCCRCRSPHVTRDPDAR